MSWQKSHQRPMRNTRFSGNLSPRVVPIGPILVGLFWVMMFVGPACKTAPQPATPKPAAGTQNTDTVHSGSPVEPPTDSAAAEPAQRDPGVIPSPEAAAPQPTAMEPKPTMAADLEPGTAPWIFAKAQEVHGGLAELEKLGRLTLTATGTDADGTEIITQIRWAYPVTLHLSETRVGSTQTWGYDAEGCWAQRGPAVVGCAPLVDNTLGYAVQAIRHGSLLPPAPSEPVLLPPAVVSGVECPTIQIGEVVLSFHPETYLLMSLSNPGHRGEQGRFETTFSDWATVGGAKFPTGRTTRFAGADVCTERWTDVKIAGPEGVAAHRPAQVEDGSIFHLTTEPMIVAVQTIKHAELNLPAALAQLVEFAGKHGLKQDFAPQFILTPIVSEGDPEVTLAIPLMSSVDVKPKRGDKIRIETWPPRHVVRVYHRGNIDGLDSKVSVLADGLRTKNATKVPKIQPKKVGHYDAQADTAPNAISYLELEVNEAPAGP